MKMPYVPAIGIEFEDSIFTFRICLFWAFEFRIGIRRMGGMAFIEAYLFTK